METVTLLTVFYIGLWNRKGGEGAVAMFAVITGIIRYMGKKNNQG